MTFAVRGGDAHDIEAIMPVMQAAFDPSFGEAWSAEQCRGVMTLPGTWLILAVTGEAVAGFALWRSVLEDAELLLIAVRPEQQSLGAGNALLDHIERAAALNGVTKLHVEVRSDNHARRFYEARGFEKTGTRQNYYKRTDNGPNDAVTLSLILNPPAPA